MELIAKVSKGTKIDQIYIPKKRIGFPIGNYVKITSLTDVLANEYNEKPIFYGLENIEPIKIKIVEEVFEIINNNIENINIIITGSFLDKGFNFHDLDILIICESINTEIIENIKKAVEKRIINNIGIKSHLIVIDNESLMKGLLTDPLYQSMLSRCISKKRIIYKIELEKMNINYKLLDLQLLKSKIVLDAFDSLTGEEKYYYLQNLIAIYLFLKSGKITKDNVEKEIKKFGDREKIKQNIIEKKLFIREYKKLYNYSFGLILKHLGKNDTKQG